jgi:L-alanine-DL-glutamate epimerase-like enolase superfamily enzyme
MRITRVGSVLMRSPPWVLVRVVTDDGPMGLGEAYHGAGVHRIAVDPRLTGALLGRDPRDVERLASDMGAAMSGSGFYQGAVMSAISGVEMALWDLAGQAAGVPIWQLFGGRMRERVPLYVTGHNGVPDTPAAYARRAEGLQRLGMRALKLSVHPRSPGDEPPLHLVRSVHDVLDEHTWLAVDAHGSCDPKGALRLAERLAPLGLRWLEDPIPPENPAAMVAVTAASPVPICTGENLYGVHGFRELLTRHGTDIASPDIAKTGGLAQGRRIADLAASYGVLMAPHDIGSPVQAVAAGHLACSLPNLLAMEQHFPDLPLWHQMVSDHQLIADGELVVPDRPGLGIRLDDAVVRRHLREEHGFFGSCLRRGGTARRSAGSIRRG